VLSRPQTGVDNNYYTAFCVSADYGAQVGDSNPSAVRDISSLRAYLFSLTQLHIPTEHHGHFLLNGMTYLLGIKMVNIYHASVVQRK
jgi:hypothetical protein